MSLTYLFLDFSTNQNELFQQYHFCSGFVNGSKERNLKNGPNSHIRLKTVDPNQLVMLVIFGTGLRHICLIAEESIAPEFETQAIAGLDQ